MTAVPSFMIAEVGSFMAEVCAEINLKSLLDTDF